MNSVKNTSKINPDLLKTARLAGFDLTLIDHLRDSDFNLIKNINQKAAGGINLAHLIVLFNHHDIISNFFDLGLDFEIKDDNGQNSLIYAAKYNSVECIKKLLDIGINPDCDNSFLDKYNHHETPLHHVKTVEAADILIKEGAHLDYVNKAGNDPLMNYLKNFSFKPDLIDLKLLNKLIYPSNSDIRNVYAYSAMHLAVLTGNLKAVELLIDNGYDIDVLASMDKKSTFEFSKVDNSTPLSLSVENNFYHITERLLKDGADINFQLDKGAMLLKKSILNENPKMLLLLIKYGADPESLPSFKSLFDFAIKNHKFSMLESINKGVENFEIIKINKKKIKPN